MNGFRLKCPLFGVPRIKDRILSKIADLHQRGVEGDKEAVKEAYAFLEKVRRYTAEDNLIEAYYGSILTLMGRDALDPIERFEYVRQGLKFLDNAVANEPDHVKVRILRGYVCYRLPEVFFHRTATSVEDFSYLILCYQQKPDLFSEVFFRQIEHDLKLAKQTLSRSEERRNTHRHISRSHSQNTAVSEEEGKKK